MQRGQLILSRESGAGVGNAATLWKLVLPQRPQKMTTAELLTLVRGLLAAGRKVYACYEAGPCECCGAPLEFREELWKGD